MSREKTKIVTAFSLSQKHKDLLKKVSDINELPMSCVIERLIRKEAESLGIIEPIKRVV